METIQVRTGARTAFVDITGEVREVVRQSGVVDGVATVFVPHTTAGISINEAADPDVVVDMAAALAKVVPWRANYRHVEGNSAAHVCASLMGASLQVLVVGGALQLGTWQGIYFCEFDGPRQRKVYVAVQ